MERVLKIAILRRGIPRSLYVDNGRVYVSTQLAAVCATLGIRQIHSTPYTPNSRGNPRPVLRHRTGGNASSGRCVASSCPR